MVLLLGRDHAGESEGVGPGVHQADAALQVLGEDAHRGDEEDPRLPQGILPGLHTSTDNFFPVPSNANSSDAFSSLKSVIRNRVVDPVSKLFLLFLLLWFIFAHLDPDPANQNHLWIHSTWDNKIILSSWSRFSFTVDFLLLEESKPKKNLIFLSPFNIFTL